MSEVEHPVEQTAAKEQVTETPPAAETAAAAQETAAPAAESSEAAAAPAQEESAADKVGDQVDAAVPETVKKTSWYKKVLGGVKKLVKSVNK